MEIFNIAVRVGNSYLLSHDSKYVTASFTSPTEANGNKMEINTGC